MRLLAVSPHLDDAVFSAGGTLAALASGGAQVTVLTCFTGNVTNPTGFALECQLDKGLDARTDYMALRRAEDLEACSIIGAAAEHLPLLEAPHRGYNNAAALFATPLPQDDIAQPLGEALASAVARIGPDIILGPAGIGHHVDHLIVRNTLRTLADHDRLIEWEDYPYAMRSEQIPQGIVRRSLKANAAGQKLQALLAYGSQLEFQFGGRDKAVEVFQRWKEEGFSGSAHQQTLTAEAIDQRLLPTRQSPSLGSQSR